ncbi:Uncharacterised protein [Chlamydia trachomatis]|nr:Uncharacterised protein [Chlamydia trachomatis]
MVDIIEETFNVNVNTVMLSSDIYEAYHPTKCMMCTPIRSKTITMRMELCFTNWFKYLKNRLLN